MLVVSANDSGSSLVAPGRSPLFWSLASIRDVAHDKEVR